MVSLLALQDFFSESEDKKETYEARLTILLSLSRQDLNQNKDIFIDYWDEDLWPTLPGLLE